ncbi:hypothetical protein B0H34DRAFT_696615 [Crassisporium funariophilum]|nr:hypothetical protein B0H34DRAFT_696615 [Crassisporium funariophilum]
MLLCLVNSLNSSQIPLDAAVAACAVTAFWGQCRLGKLLSSSSYDLSTMKRPSRSAFQQSKTSDCTHILCLPQTKTKCSGNGIVLIHQHNNTDPLSLIQNHFRINNLHETMPLFCYQTPKGLDHSQNTFSLNAATPYGQTLDTLAHQATASKSEVQQSSFLPVFRQMLLKPWVNGLPIPSCTIGAISNQLHLSTSKISKSPIPEKKMSQMLKGGPQSAVRG